jgi:hypothetical protein
MRSSLQPAELPSSGGGGLLLLLLGANGGRRAEEDLLVALVLGRAALVEAPPRVIVGVIGLLVVVQADLHLLDHRPAGRGPARGVSAARGSVCARDARAREPGLSPGFALQLTYNVALAGSGSCVACERGVRGDERPPARRSAPRAAGGGLRV